MTCEEAAKILADDYSLCPAECEGDCNKCVKGAKGMAIEALEKQISKKPIEKDTEKPCLYCPACDVELFVENHHCKCGQAIDWGCE